jgi:thiol-disulfide isomerase/thioredoxin
MKYFQFTLTNKSWIVVGFAILFLVSCRSETGKKEAYPEFKPYPKKIEQQDVETLKIGDPTPGFNLPDISGRYYSLKDFSKSDVLVVIFTCNHCPTAQAYEDRIIRFTGEYKDKGVDVVAISPTSMYGLLLEECGYSDLDDSYESMQIRARDKGFNFPYLYDGDDQAVSIKYGPTATPHAFVFDRERKLQYVGRIDSSEKPGTANNENVENPVTKSFGCSIKWSWKTEWTEKVNKEWNEKEIGLENLDVPGIEQLKENRSEKLRLINVWATWCGPCIIEYPELVKLQRMYGARAFEFISLSADDPDNRSDVLAFLESKHSAVTNYIFTGGDKYTLIEAVDPEWDGALPYTLLIEPGGKIIYSNPGVVDLLELKKTIVEHPLMGRYY